MRNIYSHIRKIDASELYLEQTVYQHIVRIVD